MKITKKHAIIMGAMKSGTTSLFNYMSQHPEICQSKTKEPNYFTNKTKYDQGYTHYRTLWDDSEEHKVLLEASNRYTKHPIVIDVPKIIYDYGIDPFMIYIVRNPLDRILSHYNHSVYRNRTCNILDQHLQDVSDYYMQLEQYKKYFPKDRILIIDFEELKNNAQQTMNSVFSFLELKNHEVKSEIIHNKTKDVLAYRLYRRFFKKNKQKLKSQLTSHERQIIFDSLRHNMLKFGSEYNFNVEKWGFK